MEGRLVYWCDKGYGFIEPAERSARDEGDIYVHETALIGDVPTTLRRGTRFRFDVVEGPRGRKALNVEVIAGRRGALLAG
jgi:CspA family cold shock protein